MISLTLKDARRSIAAVEKHLRAGRVPPGVTPAKGALSALASASADLGVNVTTLRSRLKPGGSIETQHGLGVNWSLWKAPAALPPPAPEDPVEVRRLRDRLTLEVRGRTEAERRAAGEASIRVAVLRLAETPLAPPSWNPAPASDGRVGEAIILPISDLHMGEVVDLGQMGGRNSYNEKIARKRVERLFQAAVKLATVHWSGPRPGVIYVPLMGDLVTGEIHEELAKTNDLLSIPAVRAASEVIIAGLKLLRQAFPRTPIKVISVPGNHGRTTRKPEAKGFALNSYDTLVAWVVESWFAARGDALIEFSAPASGDALVKIHGWNVLFTHGDRIGSRGGAGFIGPAATVARGMQRLIQDYAAEGSIVDFVVMGHFHTPLELEYGFVNSSIIGPSEYSRSGRMKSHPASQWMLTVHPKRGIARRWKIQVGEASEGSIYRGRAA